MKRLILLILLLVPALAFTQQTLEPATASQTVIFGPIVDSVDASAEVGLAPIADAEFTVCQDGGSCAAKSDTTDATHAGDGNYIVTFNATDSTANDAICVFTNITGTLARKECYPIETSDFKDLRNGTTALMTSRQAGNPLLTTIDVVTTQTSMSMATGPSNNDALNELVAYIVGGTEECEQRITDYTGAGADFTIEAACPFIVATSDQIYVFNGSSGSAMRVAQTDLDISTGPDGVIIQTDGVNAFTTAVDAIDADALAASAVDELWDEVVETAGLTYTGRCLLAALGAYVAGTVNTVGNTSTYKDTSDASTRIVGTTTASGRGTMSITCP